MGLEWLAGLLEGEAWFGERRRNDGGVPRPYISLKMTDRDVVERVAEMFGTAVTFIHRVEPQHKDQWVTRCQGNRAIEIMRGILPFMGKRRTETIEMLLFLYEDAPVGHAGKTHCPEGHEYDYVSPTGKRGCRRCRNSASKRYRAA